jgi:glycerate-2-kinase
MDVAGHRLAAIARALDGDGRATREARRAAFDATGAGLPEPVRALLAKVTDHAYRITDEDVAAAKAHLSEDELFELVVCASYGKAARQLAAAQAAIDEVG